MASMKLMAPVFTAFDHSTYYKVISQHVADVLCMPPNILTMFERGAFVVSICGTPWHSVGLIDEAHEMLVNRGIKTSLVRPSPDFLKRLAHYLPYMTKALETFPELKQKQKPIDSLISSNSNDLKFMGNVTAMMNTMETHKAFSVASQRGLLNPYTLQQATNEQSHDMGEKEYFSRIECFILKTPSVEAPNRQQRLQTFSVKIVRTRNSHRRKRIIYAMMKKIQYSKRTDKPIEKPGEQLLELPWLSVTTKGNH